MAAPVARAASEGGAAGLAVGTVGEGIELREARTTQPVLLLSEAPAEACDDVVAGGLTPTLCSEDAVARMAAAARRLGTRLAVHVKVDTGMHRIGADPAAVPALAAAVDAEASLRLEGLWTHLAVADGTREEGPREPEGQTGRLDAGAARPRRAPGQFQRPRPDRLLPAHPRHDLVHELPGHRPLAADPLRLGGEVVGKVAADAPLVGDPGQAAGPREHAEQRKLRQRDGRGAVVDQHDVLARQGQFVTAARGGAVHRRQVDLPGAGGGVLDPIPGLVGELAEVHLLRVRRGGQHRNVRPGAEHPVLRAGQHHGPDLRMLEPQPLDRVVQLDVHAQVVGIQLELVARDQPGGRIDVHGQDGDLPVHRQPPVPVAAGMDAEVHRFGCVCVGHRTIVNV